MRIAIAQINSTLGAFSANAEKILNEIERARGKNSDLVVFPECALFGYHPFDLLEQQELVKKQIQVLDQIHKKIPVGMAVVLGHLSFNPAKKGRPYFNSASLLVRGKKRIEFHKQLLPTGDVFDEARFIEPGEMKNNFFEFKGVRFFVSICEDIWAWPHSKKADGGKQSFYRENPLEKIKARGKNAVDMVINLSASPYHLGKMQLRNAVCKATAKHFNAPILYCNLVGAQDEIVFDGASFVMAPTGKKILSCYPFREDLNVFELESKSAWHKAHDLESTEELRQALVLGIRDFISKTGQQRVHLGLSGGIDSALVAALAVDALGPANVQCLWLPGPFSSNESEDLAKNLCKNMGLSLKYFSINQAYDAMKSALDAAFGLNGFGVVHENLQARLRGMTLMAYANAFQSMLLTTGNKSEYATGYATLYGDMCGGLAPIGDLTKAQVVALAKHYNRESEMIPSRIITRPPTAELRANQKDQDSLPPYDDLDQSVVRLVEKGCAPETATDQWLLPVLMRTEFKRWQAAPILKVSAHAFGRGRRYPVAARF
jgi:NAD+ synthase (glutamine-hydrolysing)